MNSFPISEHDEQDQEIIRLLKQLRAFESSYPQELFAATRAAFLAFVEQMRVMEIDDGLSAEDEEIVDLLGGLRSAQAEYPPHLLAARRSALLQYVGRVETPSLLDRFRAAFQRILPSGATRPGGRRFSLVLASLLAAVFFGSVFLSRPEPSFTSLPLQVTAAPTQEVAAGASEVALIVCGPDDETSDCSPEGLDADQDLAHSGNGGAKPAVSNEGVHAAYVNDGRRGESWVSSHPDSWLKIDLGEVTTINLVSLVKGSPQPSNDDGPGQFVISVALSDTYADGDSSDDYREYAQVFRSAQTDFNETVSTADTIRAQFPPTQARFVKITFEKAGTSVEEVGVFMVQPPVLAGQPTRPTQDDETEVTPPSAVLSTATSVSASTALPTDTPWPSPTPTPLPTDTLLPTDTSTPVPTDTPVPPPIDVPPTQAAPTDPPVSTETIVVTGNNQNLTFTCSGNAAEIRGHSNTVTLLGTCSSITVTGNSNQVFWQSGAPVITNRGRDNIIRQL